MQKENCRHYKHSEDTFYKFAKEMNESADFIYSFKLNNK